MKPSRIFVNNYGGGNFLSEDGGETWRVSSDGYTGALIAQVAVAQDDPARVYASARSGLFASRDGGDTWQGLGYGVARTLEGLALAIDPNDALHVLAILMDGGVTWEPSSAGMPFPNMPGVLSMDIRRPFPEDQDRYQIFFGTFDDDNVPQEDTYLPLIKESQFCAPCHFGVFWDTVVYNSFGEWLESPYSDPASGKTCQQCHTPAPTMLDGEPMPNVAPGKGGVGRDPLTIPAHTFPGAANVELLQNAVTMTTTARLEEDQIIVTVSITNDETGHHVPTDSPLRHLILLVQATDGQGQALPQLDGPTVPEWGGVGDPTQGPALSPALSAVEGAAEGYYAGLPGKGFARVLQELWTEISPTGAYWNPTRVLSDNRLAAFAADTSTYTFVAPTEGEATVEVTLLFRRAFKELMDQKGWDVPDIVMEREVITLSASQ